jgi:hypothetical protein
MRFFKETLLSIFVIGVVLYVYLLAAGAALFDVCRLVSSAGEPEVRVI